MAVVGVVSMKGHITGVQGQLWLLTNGDLALVRAVRRGDENGSVRRTAPAIHNFSRPDVADQGEDTEVEHGDY